MNALLLENVRSKLKGQTVTVGSFVGGAQIKIEGKRMTIDITDKALSELLASYVRKDFRKILFQ